MGSLLELQKPVWHSEDSVQNGIKFDTKATMRWYCQPSPMHATPGQYTNVMQRLNHLHLGRLRKLLKSSDKIPATEVLKKAGMQCMHTVLKLAKLRWTDHFIRMPDEQLPKSATENYRGKALSRWPEETLQRQPQRLSEGV